MRLKLLTKHDIEMSKPSNEPVAGQDDRTSLTIAEEGVNKIINLIRDTDRTLPRFDGRVLDWPLFIQKYRDTTAKFKISDDANQRRLLGALSGEPKALVSEYLKHNCFLEEVIELLEGAYGNPDYIADVAIATTNAMPCLHQELNNISSFQINAVKVQYMIRQCVDYEMWRQVLPKMICKLPLPIRVHWHEYQRQINKPNMGNLDDFVRWLRRMAADCKPIGATEIKNRIRQEQGFNHTQGNNPNDSSTFYRRENELSIRLNRKERQALRRDRYFKKTHK